MNIIQFDVPKVVRRAIYGGAFDSASTSKLSNFYERRAKLSGKIDRIENGLTKIDLLKNDRKGVV